jgi:hypothetical protein
MGKMDIIPPMNQSSYAGAVPNIISYSDQDLPRPLVENWKPSADAQPNPIEIGLKIPERLHQKAKEIQKTVSEAFGSKTSESPASKPTPPVDKTKSPQKKKKNRLLPSVPETKLNSA